MDYLFNCIEYDEDVFSDATIMAQALENAKTITRRALEIDRDIDLSMYENALKMEATTIQVLGNGVISIYDDAQDIHYFFK